MEIEILEKNLGSYNLHKKVKEADGMYRSTTKERLHDENGKFIIDKEEKMNFWRDYIEQLYEDTIKPENSYKFSQTIY